MLHASNSLINRGIPDRVRNGIYERWEGQLTERYLGSNLALLPRYRWEDEPSSCQMKMAPTLLINRASPALFSSSRPPAPRRAASDRPPSIGRTISLRLNAVALRDHRSSRVRHPSTARGLMAKTGRCATPGP